MSLKKIEKNEKKIPQNTQLEFREHIIRLADWTQ